MSDYLASGNTGPRSGDENLDRPLVEGIVTPTPGLNGVLHVCDL